MARTSLLLKLTGELFSDTTLLPSLVADLATLSKQYSLGIVVGGGNFFRGSSDGKRLGLSAAAGHEVGMLATIMNGRILHDHFEQAGTPSTLMSALLCPTITEALASRTIHRASKQEHIMIFAGGTGNPFCSTDTTAIIRALQIGASEVWKATKVDGVYDKDPKQFADAKRYDTLTYHEATSKKLAIMDQTALTLAEENRVTTYVFDIFKPGALLSLAKDRSLATKITP